MTSHERAVAAQAAAGGPSAPPSVARAGRFGVRAIAAGLALVIGVLLLPVAVVGLWGQATLLNPQKYLEVVGPLADDPAVQAVATSQLSRAIHDSWNARAYPADTLPPALRPMTGPLTAAIEVGIDREVRSFVTGPAFGPAWLALNRTAQQSLIRVLSGSPSAFVSSSGDKVVLDTAALIEQVRRQLVDRGFTALAHIQLPTGPQILLLDPRAVRAARTGYALSVPVASWLGWVVALLLVAAVLLARRRHRMIIVMGGAVVLMMLLLRVGIEYGKSRFDATLAHTAFGPAAPVFYARLTRNLVTAGWGLAAVGAFLIPVAVGFGRWHRTRRVGGR